MTFRYFHPIAFNAVRFTVSSAAMFLVLKMRGEGLRIAAHDIRQILWLGFIANAFYQFLFVLGLARTGAGNGALIMALSPVFAFLIGVATGRERFSRGVLIGIIMSLAGVAAIVAFGSEGISFAGSWRGDLLMMAASICWGWQSAESTRLLGKYGPRQIRPDSANGCDDDRRDSHDGADVAAMDHRAAVAEHCAHRMAGPGLFGA